MVRVVFLERAEPAGGQRGGPGQKVLPLPSPQAPRRPGVQPTSGQPRQSPRPCQPRRGLAPSGDAGSVLAARPDGGRLQRPLELSCSQQALALFPDMGPLLGSWEVTRPWCPRSTCWWSLRTPTAPATSGRSPWTSPTTSSASVPATATTSGGRGSGLAGAGLQAGAGLLVGGASPGGELASPPAPHASPTSSSQFCRDAATSLSLFYNNGARPCGCHEVGATGPTCEPFGGQCPCRAYVIGRDCSRCATGYWGFPTCRREYLGPGLAGKGAAPDSGGVLLVWGAPPEVGTVVRRTFQSLADQPSHLPSVGPWAASGPGLTGLSRRFQGLDGDSGPLTPRWGDCLRLGRGTGGDQAGRRVGHPVLAAPSCGPGPRAGQTGPPAPGATPQPVTAAAACARS